MKKCIFIFVLLFVLTITTGCSFGNDSAKENVVTQRTPLNWVYVVSPDGVHYWLYHNGYGGHLVPRYGADGKIVVD